MSTQHNYPFFSFTVAFLSNQLQFTFTPNAPSTFPLPNPWFVNVYNMIVSNDRNNPNFVNFGIMGQSITVDYTKCTNVMGVSREAWVNSVLNLIVL